MRYLTYMYDKKESAGVLIDNKVYSFETLFGSDAPKTMIDYIRYESIKGSTDFKQLVQDKKCVGIEYDRVTVKSPIPYPIRNIICLGKNYEDHAKEIPETGMSQNGVGLVPTTPVYFAKSAYPTIGLNDYILSHSDITSKVDYEVELAVIIGKECDRIKEEDVENFIFGYTIINEVSARDLQVAHNQWFRGKSLDGFCPMGPVIVDKSEISFPVELNLSTKVNGEIRQNSNTKMFIFTIAQTISWLSHGMKLYPGDIIATGTPAGVGHGLKPPQYLKAGDIVECEIERIGVLRNPVM